MLNKRCKMVRPRASQQNLNIALAFSKTVLVQMESFEAHKSEDIVHVSCNGQRGVFAAFSVCFPDLVRDSRDKRPQNRQGVAAIEMNKSMQVHELVFGPISFWKYPLTVYLQASGFTPVRKQERIDGADGPRWRPKVSRHSV